MFFFEVSGCQLSFIVSFCAASSRLDDDPFNGQVRLVGGTFPSEGLVEVYCSGEWGTVCEIEFDSLDATTICLQLGYNAYLEYTSVGLSS